MKTVLTTSITVLLLTAAQFAAAGSAPGKSLHDASCHACHDDSVYSRPNHRMQNYAQLDHRVGRCANSVGADWSADQQGAVTDYLNDTWYKFDPLE